MKNGSFLVICAVEWDDVLVCEAFPHLHFLEESPHLHRRHDDFDISPFGKVDRSEATKRQRSAGLFDDLVMQNDPGGVLFLGLLSWNRCVVLQFKSMAVATEASSHRRVNSACWTSKCELRQADLRKIPSNSSSGFSAFLGTEFAMDSLKNHRA